MIPDKKALESGLYNLYEDISSTLSLTYDHPLSEQDMQAAATNLLTYLTHYIARNKRRAKAPILATNLQFNVLRTYNPSETTIDDEGNKTKGEKEWYYLVLSESPSGIGNGGPVQIVAEGALRKDKAELLDGFREMVETRNQEWDKEDEVRHEEWLQKKKRERERKEEEEIAKREIAEMEKRTRKVGVGKKGKKKGKSRARDLVDEEDLEDE